MTFERQRGDLTISDDKSRLEIDVISRWLDDSYWAHGRPAETIATTLANSRVYGVYDNEGRQVAMARAVTDSAVFAWIADVMVDPLHRGKGIGGWLVGTVVEHLRSLGVARFLLGTRDAHEVYRRLGFDAPANPGFYMEIDDRPV
jgi:GNAT superfamily N-acetyltransferase